MFSLLISIFCMVLINVIGLEIRDYLDFLKFPNRGNRQFNIEKRLFFEKYSPMMPRFRNNNNNNNNRNDNLNDNIVAGISPCPDAPDICDYEDSCSPANITTNSCPMCCRQPICHQDCQVLLCPLSSADNRNPPNCPRHCCANLLCPLYCGTDPLCIRPGDFNLGRCRNNPDTSEDCSNSIIARCCLLETDYECI